MKTSKANNFVVFGTGHAGWDTKIVKLFSTVTDYFNATPVHVGALCTADKKTMWERRVNRIRAFEETSQKKLNKKGTEIESKMADYSMQMDELTATWNKSVDKKGKIDEKVYNAIQKEEKSLQEKMDKLAADESFMYKQKASEMAKMSQEAEILIDDQRMRVQTWDKCFTKKVHVVCNDELMIPDSKITSDPGYHDFMWELNSNISITSVPANGDKMSSNPITPKTFRMLKNLGNQRMSHIIPHASPATKPFNRKGTNKAYNYTTTGCMVNHGVPKRGTDAWKSMTRAGCVLVTLDTKTESFFVDRLKVQMHKGNPYIIFDGLVFGHTGLIGELKGKDISLFFTDMHCPYQHPGVTGTIRTANVLTKAETVVDNGDTSDYESLNSHAAGAPGYVEGLRLIDDILTEKGFLDCVTNPKEFPWIKFRQKTDSNHAEWITQQCERLPALKGFIDWPTLSKWFFPEWDIMIRSGGDDKVRRIGNLDIKHGDGEGTIAAASDTYGNYAGGHHHRFIEWLDAIFFGAGCKLGPKFLKNRATAWQNQIGIFSTWKGYTHKQPKTIIHQDEREQSRFSYRGKVYIVDWVYSEKAKVPWL